MHGYTDKKVMRESRLEKAETVGHWHVTVQGIYCGHIERKPRYGYTVYRLFDINGQYLGIGHTRTEAKLFVAFHHLQEVLKYDVKVK